MPSASCTLTQPIELDGCNTHTTPSRISWRNRLLSLAFGTLVFFAEPGIAEETHGPTSPGSLSTNQQTGSSLSGLKFPSDAIFNFTERTGNALLTAPLQRGGRLWQEQRAGAEPTLIMELEAPRWERRELSETHVSLVRRRPATGRSRPGEQRLSMTLDERKSGHTLMLALVALVNGDLDRLLSQFSAGPRLATTAGWQIDLTPKTTIDGLCALRLNGDGDEDASRLTSIYLDQCDQSWQEIVLQRVGDQ